MNRNQYPGPISGSNPTGTNLWVQSPGPISDVHICAYVLIPPLLLQTVHPLHWHLDVCSESVPLAALQQLGVRVTVTVAD